MTNNILNSQRIVREELLKMGLDNLADAMFGYFEIQGKDLDSITGHVNDDTTYFVPSIIVTDFDETFSGRSEVNKSKHPKRDGVWFYGDGVIKTAKKGLLYAVVDQDNPHEINLKRSRIAAELVTANHLGGKLVRKYHGDTHFGLDVVEPIVMLEERTNKGRLVNTYLVEKRFEPMPDVRGKLSRDHFSSDTEFRKVREAYEAFLARNKQKGVKYLPADDERPYADLVYRRRRGEGLQILATDWPHFKRIK
jgi:hypothetical protein